MLLTTTTHNLFVITDFDLDNVLFELQRAKFPAEKWKSLANGLKLASAVPIVKADESDVVGKLQALISRWVKSTTQLNQWITLVEAIVMCDEPAVARDLATAVGVDYPPHSGTTIMPHRNNATCTDFAGCLTTTANKQHVKGDQGMIGIPALIDCYGTILC